MTFKDFPREGGGCVYLIILFNLRGFVFSSVIYNAIPGQFGFARYYLLFTTLKYADRETDGGEG